MVMGDGLTLGGGHTMQHTDLVSQKCTLETYMILLTTVNPINLNFENCKHNAPGNILHALSVLIYFTHPVG